LHTQPASNYSSRLFDCPFNSLTQRMNMVWILQNLTFAVKNMQLEKTLKLQSIVASRIS